MNNLAITYKATADLLPYINNAKKHSADQVAMLAASIKEFGFNNPILTDGDNGVIAGHGRLQAAQKLGLETVPTIELSHLSAAQKKAYILADNRLGEVGTEWDMELVNLELEALSELDFDLSLTGFELELGDEEPDYQGDPDEIPEISESEPVTQRGMIWLCGEHRVMCGDSTSAEDVDQLMAGGVADMWLTDPPYNVNYTGKTKDALTIDNDSMSDGSFREFLVGAYRCADSVMRSGAVFYIWHADLEGFNFRGAAADIGWRVRQCLIWVKNSIVLGRQDYHWRHEPCLYGWKDGAAHLWSSDRKQATTLQFDRPTRNDIHPTMKPVSLFEYQIKNNTRAGDIVLDSFGGSGTTLIASEQCGRTSRLMEYSPIYVDAIIARWQRHTGKQAILESDGRTFNEIAEMLGK
jgi:site-specific DNA-methyltransferase (adenine-specific)